MEIKKINPGKQNKKAVLRIIEAFIAVLIILGAVLIILARERAEAGKSEEIVGLQKNVLDYVSQDDSLRANALAGNRTYIENALRGVIPPGINYRVNICSSVGVCPNPASYLFYQGREVYSDEVLIAANLTYYQLGKIIKVKLFFWEGCGIGTGCEFLNDTAPVVEGPVCGNDICESGETFASCAEDCPLARAVLSLNLSMVISPYKSGVWYYYNHTRTFTETNGVGVNITSYKGCFLDGTCEAISSVSYNISAFGIISLNRLSKTSYNPEKFIYKYYGKDDNGNNIEINASLCVNGLTATPNC